MQASNRPCMIHRTILPATCRSPVSKRKSIPVPPNQAGDAGKQSQGYSLFQQGDRGTQGPRSGSRPANSSSKHPPIATSSTRPRRRGSRPSFASFLCPAAPGPADESGRPAERACRRSRARPASIVQAGLCRRESLRGRSQADAGERPQERVGTTAGNAQERSNRPALEPATRDQLLRDWIARSPIPEHYIDQNRSRIDLDQKNQVTRDDIKHDSDVKLQTQQKLAELVDQYNRLIQDQRFEEAEVVAKRAQELAPPRW